MSVDTGCAFCRFRNSMVYWGKTEKEQNMHVLIVDDDHMICRCLQQGIDWKKLECSKNSVCYNGAQAWEYICEQQPDIVISDVKMPVMDGKELCRRTWEQFSEISFIFLSGYEDFMTAQMAIRCHARGYILKPLDRDKLHELERLIRDIYHQKEGMELIQRIVKDEYRDYLEQALREKNREALEQFFHGMEECHNKKQFQYANVWTHVLQPLFGYRYKRRNEDSHYLYEEEQKLVKVLEHMEEKQQIGFVKQAYTEVLDWDEDEEAGAERELVWKVQRIVKEQYTSTDFNVNMLGQMLDMSPNYLGRMFVEHTGVKLIDYISSLRLELACELLKNTKKSVKEIAEAAGYGDPNYFIRLFRKKMQMKPLEYRYGTESEEKQ